MAKNHRRGRKDMPMTSAGSTASTGVGEHARHCRAMRILSCAGFPRGLSFCRGEVVSINLHIQQPSPVTAKSEIINGNIYLRAERYTG